MLFMGAYMRMKPPLPSWSSHSIGRNLCVVYSRPMKYLHPLHPPTLQYSTVVSGDDPLPRQPYLVTENGLNT
jgi:hypothetical protein